MKGMISSLKDEIKVPKEGIKWMALARVHTANFFSPQTFEQHMRVA
jgi:transcription termination factor Rho